MDEALLSFYISADGTSHGNLPMDSSESPDTRIMQYNPRLPTPRRPSDADHVPYNAVLTPDGRLNIRARKWQDKTYMLPPCPKTSAPKELKDKVFRKVINTLRTSDQDWQAKTEFLGVYFDKEAQINQAKLRATAFTIFTAPCYQWSFVNALTADYQPLPIPPGGDGPNFRTSVKFTTFNLTINPSLSNPGFPLADTVIPLPEARRVVIRLPTIIVVGAVGAPNLEQLHNNLDGNSLQVFANIAATLQLTNEILQVGFLETNYNDEDKFRSWKNKLHWHMIFEHAVPLIDNAFVGQRAARDTYQQLRECTQVWTDKTTGQKRARSIQEQYDAFMEIINEFDFTAPFPIPLTQQFYHTLSPLIQERLAARNYIPPAPGPNNDIQLQQLQQLRDFAVQVESEIKANSQLIRMVHGAQATRGRQDTNPLVMVTTPQAFQQQQQQELYSGFNAGYNYSQDTSTLLPTYTQTYTIPAYPATYPGIFNPTDATTPNTLCTIPVLEVPILVANTTTVKTFATNDDIINDLPCLVLLSTAEQAMQEASGMPAPFECWGCSEVDRYKAGRFHKYVVCPNKTLCVSYRPINAITRPFVFPSRRCDDAARDIGQSKFFITMDLLWGYWQVPLTESSKPKLAFFIPNGKVRWTVMPMGATNAHQAYNAIIETIKTEWDQIAADQGIGQVKVQSGHDLQGTGSQNIVNDVILHSDSITDLLKYFQIVLCVFSKYRVTISLKKCRFLPQTAEFVGVDIEPTGNRPAKSKQTAFENLRMHQPHSMSDLRLLIGMIGFYQEWIPLFEVRLRRWREYQKQCPPGATTREVEKEFLAHVWSDSDEKLRVELLNEIKERPTLARPNFNRRMYLKTDWCAQGRGAALLQADPDDPIAKDAEHKEVHGGPCIFDQVGGSKTMRLRPLAFISQRNTKAEQAYHSYYGEAKTGSWAMKKFRRYLMGQEFTWITDCISLRQFFDQTASPTHAEQRLRMEMLLFDFTIVHRPEHMMKDVDPLGRYNSWTQQWRTPNTTEPQIQPFSALLSIPNIATLPFSQKPPQTVGPSMAQKTLLALKSTTARTIWTINSATNTCAAAAIEIGLQADITAELEDREMLDFDPSLTDQVTSNYLSTQTMLQRLLIIKNTWIGLSPTMGAKTIPGGRKHSQQNFESWSQRQPNTTTYKP